MNLATDATASQYDAAYLAAQPKEVQTLMQTPGGQSRVQEAQRLANAGYRIDTTVMVWGWSAYWTMKSRQMFGYTWTPSVNMPPVTSAPGIPGFSPPYDAHIIPAGAFIVTLDIDQLTPANFAPLPGTPAAEGKA